MHKTLGGEEKVHRTILQTWCTTNGIYFHGLGWGIPPTIIKRRPLCTYKLSVCWTNFVFCIPLKNKSASEIVTAWRNHIAFPFGVSRKMLTDNGTEFKNSLFAEVAKELGLGKENLFTTHTDPNQMVYLKVSTNF